MPDLAQTNVQLLRQVFACGWSDEDLVRLQRAYEFAMWAYSGQHRGSGKTQIAHHVGAASALVATGARPPLATASLVHSLYFFGDFGNGRRGADPDKQARVRSTLGDEIELLVDAYPGIKWTEASVRQMTADADHATPLRRDLVALRVANAVDEYTDAEIRLAPRPHRPGDLVGDRAVEAMAELAEAHGLAALASLLREQARRADALSVPDVLVTRSERMVFVPPASYRRRLHVAVQDSRVGHSITETVPGARRAGVWARRRIA